MDALVLVSLCLSSYVCLLIVYTNGFVPSVGPFSCSYHVNRVSFYSQGDHQYKVLSATIHTFEEPSPRTDLPVLSPAVQHRDEDTPFPSECICPFHTFCITQCRDVCTSISATASYSVPAYYFSAFVYLIGAAFLSIVHLSSSIFSLLSSAPGCPSPSSPPSPL